MNGGAAPKIAVRGVEKSFGRKRVLDGIDIDCAVGESLVIIGGSGTGKSVLIKCILGLLHPEAGSIRIDGEETVGHRPQRRANDSCTNSACCFRAAPCSIRCWCGRMSRSGLSKGAAWNGPGHGRSRSQSWRRSGLAPRWGSCGRPSFRAACKSASRWRARSPPSPKSSSSTSRPPDSTRSWPM